MLGSKFLENSQTKLEFQPDEKNIPLGRNSRHWYNWLISKPFDWISTPIYLGACLSLFYDRNFYGSSYHVFEWWQITALVVATFILLAIDRYEYWRWGEEMPMRVATGYFLLRVGLVALISVVNPNEITLFMYLIIPFSALIYFGSGVGIGVGLLTWLIFAIRVLFFATIASEMPRPLPFINIFTICLIFIMTTAYTLRREKSSRTNAERLLKELKQSQRQVEELAATRERNRLARDIHDSLGHYLTVISVLLGKARAFKEKNPAEAEQAVTDARRLANEALQDVRESIKSLRTSQELFSLERKLPVLVANLQNEHLKIELEISGSEAGFSKQVLMVLYRVAQEGLTNVQRHSDASRARLQLKFEVHVAELTLEDNGKGFDLQNLSTGQSSGYGLLGLQERLEITGGEFLLDSQPGKGTRLVARVCKTSAAATGELG
ncbi:MAG: sensor histidine kinase [Chloroflexi bacterium]|uniref:histidine kinase n=1 Tax=Candidatus Chlorohelix allophototropha TaxID=3003348 RepID=A0A8T7M4J5_9CHLR|nr:sensor histidine kinase [Chloroflexota bacterium]WJW69997.1 sensor histidine kinase [Chloroflexota bacterium L227-S17]